MRGMTLETKRRTRSASEHLLHLQRRQAGLTVLLPTLGFGALLWRFDPRAHWVILFAVLYFSSMLGVTAGYHRLLTHGAFSVGPRWRAFFTVLGCLAGEGPPLVWVANHRRHHQYSDAEGDPHSPHPTTPSKTARVASFFHAHLGWMFTEPPANVMRYAPDLLRDPVVVRVGKHYRTIVVLGVVLPGVFGAVYTSSFGGFIDGMLWGGLGRLFLVQHATWCINSVCHVFGTRPWQTKEQSRNNVILGVFALGEGWHNNHHAAPTSARFGFRWWQLDIPYWVISGLARVGLARDVKLPSPERLAARALSEQAAESP